MFTYESLLNCYAQVLSSGQGKRKLQAIGEHDARILSVQQFNDALTHIGLFVMSNLQRVMSSLYSQGRVRAGENNMVSFKVEWAVWVG